MAGIVLAVGLGGCREDPCPDPVDYSNFIAWSVRDPELIEREGARMVDAGPTDACGGLVGCRSGKCELFTLPAREPLPTDAGAPDTSACPATIPDEGTPCSSPMKCPYTKDGDSCWSVCNDFDERRMWSIACMKPSPPAVKTCPSERPSNGAPCTQPWELCTYPQTGVCVAVSVRCNSGRWFAEECFASLNAAWAIGCYGEGRGCSSIE